LVSEAAQHVCAIEQTDISAVPHRACMRFGAMKRDSNTQSPVFGRGKFSMKETIARTVIAALLLVFAATATAERVGGPSAGDLVRVTVYGQPDLMTLARVARDNTISFPFIGQVTVGGVTISRAQSNIATALERKGIVRNPQVNLLIEGLSTGDLVTILGQVRQPGRYPLVDESLIETHTLLDLLAVAGGTTESANAKVTVFRIGAGDKTSEDGTRVEVDLHDLMKGGNLGDANLVLQSGDVVVVPEADVFYIYGQVSRPGRYPLTKDMMVMQAISVGGGVTERGNENGLVLTRLKNDRQEKLTASLDDTIQAGDVIYVKERFF
jgi:polysaccharide export outer membrane protein